ncbi:energy transducer TonB [Pontibacter mangrovi]|uniref:TonB C-terminal domain-containing protein n=1 Tax=Pontibacter mangrovi TaxID=2589816 RepID=A0A501VW63_9BACT|nr:energy transducer TonB [Pontibacter mangrovi]TPE40652.1 hypothetical protein FJM65_20150 [Pontibacter mangrovi]
MVCIKFVIAVICLVKFALEVAVAQPTTIADTTVYSIVDTYPVLVTKEKEYKFDETQSFIDKHLKWPDPRLDCNGSVMISLIVEKDGTVSNRKYLKALCPKFDEEAMRVINFMNDWKPGRLNGDAVRTVVVLPVRFKLH